VLRSAGRNVRLERFDVFSLIPTVLHWPQPCVSDRKALTSHQRRVASNKHDEWTMNKPRLRAKCDCFCC